VVLLVPSSRAKNGSARARERERELLKKYADEACAERENEGDF
jgi:hypothetical protein